MKVVWVLLLGAPFIAAGFLWAHARCFFRVGAHVYDLACSDEDVRRKAIARAEGSR